MKRNLNKPIVYVDGKTIKNENQVGVMAADLVARGLFEVAGSNVTLTPDEKYKCWKISQKIIAKPEAVDLDADDIVLIKKITAPSLSAGIYGQIVDLLEGK